MADRSGGKLPRLDMGVLERAMLDAANAAGLGVTVTFIDTDPARHAFVSEAAARILGWSEEELLQVDPGHIIAAEDLPEARARMGRRMRGDAGQSYELTAVRKDGTRVALEMATSYTTLGGRPAVFAFFSDASQRREAERQRLRNEARFREIIETAPEPIGIIRGGRFVYVNRAYLATLGRSSAEELYATPIAALLDGEGEAALRDTREALTLARHVSPPPHTYRVRRPDGSVILLEVTSGYFEYEGRPSVFSVARDVTARKQLEKQLVQSDRLAALGTMAAGVAHEINNPLAYVMLNLEWVARKLPDLARDPSSLSGLMEMVQEAHRGAERVSSIVHELRSFSRADAETRRLVDVAAVVQSAIKLTSHEIRHRARVITSVEPTPPVWANEARLEQVVINLLLNASQAMPESRAEQNEIRAAVRLDGDHHVVLEIADDGDGIPAEVLPRIFDPFFTTKPPGVGTGLGLSICHGIVTALGGQISAYSAPGEGTTFRVVLPAAQPCATQTATAGGAPSSRSGRRMRVLVVDDEPPIANALRELLAPEHEVVAATSAREALAALEAVRDFDVLFCDVVMPGTSGIDLYEKIRAARPGLERRIVFMTGGAFTARTAEFLAGIENRRVEKPFSLTLVEQIMREMAGEPAAPTGAR